METKRKEWPVWPAIALLAGGAILGSLPWLRTLARRRSASARSTIGVRARSVLGQQLPTIEGETLTGRPVRLPDDRIGNIVLLAVGFSHGVNREMLAWSAAFGDAYGERGDVAHFLLAVAGEISGETRHRMESRMRDVLPPDLWERVVIVSTPSAAMRRVLCASRPAESWIYLIDREGRVLYQAQGWSEARFDHLRRVADHVIVGANS